MPELEITHYLYQPRYEYRLPPIIFGTLYEYCQRANTRNNIYTDGKVTDPDQQKVVEKLIEIGEKVSTYPKAYWNENDDISEFDSDGEYNEPYRDTKIDIDSLSSYEKMMYEFYLGPDDSDPEYDDILDIVRLGTCYIKIGGGYEPVYPKDEFTDIFGKSADLTKKMKEALIGKSGILEKTKKPHYFPFEFKFFSRLDFCGMFEGETTHRVIQYEEGKCVLVIEYGTESG